MENLTLETFKEKIFDFENNQEWKFEGDKPAIIDFYADWCGPCKKLTPILEEIDGEFDDVNIYKIDTETEQELAAIFQIRSIPSMLFIPLEGEPQMASGLAPKDNIVKAINEILLK